MTLCLSLTHLWFGKKRNSLGDMVYTDQVHPNHSGDSVAVVVKDMKSHSSAGSVISYRAPSVIQEKAESSNVIAKSASANYTQNPTRATTESITVPFEKQEDQIKETISTIADPSIDYNSMFLQAMSERADEESVERST
jgi:hypothetical protein